MQFAASSNKLTPTWYAIGSAIPTGCLCLHDCTLCMRTPALRPSCTSEIFQDPHLSSTGEHTFTGRSALAHSTSMASLWLLPLLAILDGNRELVASGEVGRALPTSECF